ncbi:MAG: hypothetical protein NTX72_00475 [Candidatus Uhrbacteria bacterium]|nr:hypothetical protein [Candidatus Uhrbacteria bacterium]
MQQRATTSETTVLAAAIPAKDAKVIHLGAKQFQVWKAFHDEWMKTSQPISAESAERLVHSVIPMVSNWSSVLYELEQKGAMTSSEESSRKFRTPVTNGIVITSGFKSNERQCWPEIASTGTSPKPKKLKLVQPARTPAPAVVVPNIVSKVALQQQLQSKQDALQTGLRRCKQDRIDSKTLEQQTIAGEIESIEEQITALQTRLSEKLEQHETVRDTLAEMCSQECTSEEAGLQDVVTEIADLESALRVYDRIVQPT